MKLNDAIIILSDNRHPLHQKLRELVKQKAKDILKTKESPEAKTMKDLCGLLFELGTLSDKQIRWMAGFAVNNKLEV